jgi:hypothetical protein
MTRASPKAVVASERALRSACAKSAAVCTRRMPRPPPPAVALIISGKPTRSAARSSVASSCSSPSWPGMQGTPASRTTALARALSPIAAIASGDGPMNTRPASQQAAAKAAFSARNP